MQGTHINNPDLKTAFKVPFEPVGAAKGELLNASPVDAWEVDVEEVEFKTDAKGLPANCSRSSELFCPAAAAAGSAAVEVTVELTGAVAGGADTPKRSRMFGVLLSGPPAGSGAAAKGLVAFA